MEEQSAGKLDSSESPHKSMRTEADRRVPSLNLSEYKIVSMIGGGAFSEVVLAVKSSAIQDIQDASSVSENDIVALKVIRKNSVQSKTTGRNEGSMFRAEVCALRLANDNPFVVKFHGAVQTRSRFWIAIEFCCGGDLHSLMQLYEYLPLRWVQFYAAELLLALHYLHKKGLLLGDLKPENVGISKDGHIKLFDFGLSVILDERTTVDERTGRYVVKRESGTLPYCSPEVLMRHSHGLESDWWSLGVILFELAYGALPWFSEDPMEQCKMICYEPLTLPISKDSSSTLSASFEDLLSLLLVKDLSERLAFLRSCGEDLMSHPFFESVAWEDVFCKSYQPPLVPDVQSCFDVSYFHPDFTRMQPSFVAA